MVPDKKKYLQQITFLYKSMHVRVVVLPIYATKHEKTKVEVMTFGRLNRWFVLFKFYGQRAWSRATMAVLIISICYGNSFCNWRNVSKSIGGSPI